MIHICYFRESYLKHISDTYGCLHLIITLNLPLSCLSTIREPVNCAGNNVANYSLFVRTGGELNVPNYSIQSSIKRLKTLEAVLLKFDLFVESTSTEVHTFRRSFARTTVITLEIRHAAGLTLRGASRRTRTGTKTIYVIS